MKKLITILIILLAGTVTTFGDVTVTAGTGGTNLLRSLSVNGHAPGYTTLGDIVILEALVGDVKQSQTNATIILTAPSNWQFNTGAGSVSTTLGDDITAISLSLTTSTITVTLTTANGNQGMNSIDEITITGIQVQCIDGNITPAAGNIMQLSSNAGSATVAGITNDVTNFGSLSTDPGSSMPVELSSFTATVHKNMVHLLWGTITEVNNYGFEVERSIAGGEWDYIGFVEGHGNSSSPKEYEFVDDLTGLLELVPSDMVDYRLRQVDLDGAFEYYHLGDGIYLNNLTSIGDDLYPVEFELSQNYPNPFNPSTTIKFALPVSGNIILEVYNSVGQRVATLVNGNMSAGYHEVVWNASDMASGLYIYKIATQSFADVKKMLLVK